MRAAARRHLARATSHLYEQGQLLTSHQAHNVAGLKFIARCFTYRGEPIRRGVCNTWGLEAVKKAGLSDFRFHDLRHTCTWASWHRQAGTSTDELKNLGSWKSRAMVDRYAKFATEHLSAAASRIVRQV